MSEPRPLPENLPEIGIPAYRNRALMYEAREQIAALANEFGLDAVPDRSKDSTKSHIHFGFLEELHPLVKVVLAKKRLQMRHRLKEIDQIASLDRTGYTIPIVFHQRTLVEKPTALMLAEDCLWLLSLAEKTLALEALEQEAADGD